MMCRDITEKMNGGRKDKRCKEVTNDEEMGSVEAGWGLGKGQK